MKGGMKRMIMIIFPFEIFVSTKKKAEAVSIRGYQQYTQSTSIPPQYPTINPPRPAPTLCFFNPSFPNYDGFS